MEFSSNRYNRPTAVQRDQGKFKQVMMIAGAVLFLNKVFSSIGDRLLSYNGKPVTNMTVQEVADILSLLPNPCRLKLSRHTSPPINQLRRPLSVDGEMLLQEQHKQHNHSPNALSVRVLVSTRMTSTCSYSNA
jgi:hypothetical protein